MNTVPPELGAVVLTPASFADPDLIDRTYAEIRRTAPLAKTHVPGFDPMWIVSRHKHVQDISRRNDEFHSGDRTATIMPLEAEAAAVALRGRPGLVRTLVHMDGADHKAHRGLALPPLMPQNVAKLLDTVRGIARKYVHRMLERGGTLDFAGDIAFLYPLEVVMTVLGVPPEDHARMLQLTQWLFDSEDADLRRPGPPPQSIDQAVHELDEVVKAFSDYYRPFIADRRAHPRDDLGSLLSNAQVDGKPIDDYELLSYFIIASTAGHDTTAASTATGMLHLAHDGALLARIKREPMLLPGFVEESIRWASPVKHFIRSATRDTTVDGTAVREGDLMLLAYPSANRDEEVFDKPFVFDPARTPNRHVGFGYGGHVCLGQHLARAEMKIFWEEALPHIQAAELTSAATYIASNFVSGPKTVNVRLQLA